MIGRWRARWDALWFTPEGPLNLAAARIIFSLHALWILWSRDLAATSALPPVFWMAVPWGERWRYLLPGGDASVDRVLQWAAAAALISAALGLWPRLSCFAAAMLLYHLAPLETIYWMSNPFERGFTVSVLALTVLGVTRCGDALTITGRGRPRPGPSPGYRWPLVLTQIFICHVYFLAGYAKLFNEGLAWMTAENMRRWLLLFSQIDQIWTVPGLGPWVADHPLLTGTTAVFAVVLDMSLITVVIWPRLKPWLITAALGFHAGIFLMMGILFLNIPQLLVFVDWDHWALRLRGERAGEPAERRDQVVGQGLADGRA